jgi:hypothetical protein
MSTYPVKQCQRMKMNGTQCGSPAVRNQKFCYFHQRCNAVQFDVSTSAAEPAALFFLPVLEDAASIQATITQVCEHLLQRRLDPKKAGVMLYAMQVASANLDRLSQENSQESSPDTLPSETSREPNHLPPGTIQACQQPRKRVVRITARAARSIAANTDQEFLPATKGQR